MAGQHGSGRTSLSSNSELSKAGGVGANKPGTKSARFRPVQHSGGTCKRLNQGVSTSPFHHTGFTSRAGNPTDSSRTTDISREEGFGCSSVED